MKKELKMKWSKREKDLMIYYPDSSEGHLIHNMIDNKRTGFGFTESCRKEGRKIIDTLSNPNLCIYEMDSIREALEKCGYDMTTLKFSIKKEE